MNLNLQAEPSESTSRSLLERVKRQEPAAWRRFATLYGPIVYRWAVECRLPHEDAVDVTQEVFLAASQNISQFRRESAGQSLRGWLWTITRNKVRNHLRDLHPAEAAGGSAMHDQLSQLPVFDDSDKHAAQSIALEISHRALKLIQTDFEEPTWRAFWSTTVDGRTASDVAAELGLSLAAVYKAKSRVLQRLRQELAGLVD
jgi:RNA polymerase sigma-70 factor (ECF subfamily)